MKPLSLTLIALVFISVKTTYSQPGSNSKRDLIHDYERMQPMFGSTPKNTYIVTVNLTKKEYRNQLVIDSICLVVPNQHIAEGIRQSYDFLKVEICGGFLKTKEYYYDLNKIKAMLNERKKTYTLKWEK